MTAAPTVAFVAVNALSDLWTALVALAVITVGVFTARVARGRSTKGAVVGLAVAATCAAVAALTGEARAFFLLPTLLPGVIMLVCLGSVLVRRPATGILLNRIVGGPADWRTDRGLMHVYTVSTLVAVGINIVNFALQATFYLADQPSVLAVAHVATGPVFAGLVALTVVAARRRLSRD